MEDDVDQMTTHAKTAVSSSIDQIFIVVLAGHWINLTDGAPDFISQLHT